MLHAINGAVNITNNIYSYRQAYFWILGFYVITKAFRNYILVSIPRLIEIFSVNSYFNFVLMIYLTLYVLSVLQLCTPR